MEHLTSIDVYRVIDLWELNHPALQHALKKVLACGSRGVKDAVKDAQEAIDSLQRFVQMKAEDSKAVPGPLHDTVASAQYHEEFPRV